MCTEYNIRSQLQRSENNVGTFIHHFMSKYSSEILKVNLKIQQSPKAKWGSVLKSKIPSLLAHPDRERLERGEVGDETFEPITVSSATRCKENFANSLWSVWKALHRVQQQHHQSHGGRSEVSSWAGMITVVISLILTINFLFKGIPAALLEAACSSFSILGLFLSAVSPTFVWLSLTCHTHTHHNRQDGNGIRNVCHKTYQT